MLQQFRMYLLLSIIFNLPLWSIPAQVLIIRHAEKPLQGNELSIKGYERAAALVPFFQLNKEFLQFGLPVAIFAQAVSHVDSSLRPIQTVQPLANQLGLKLETQYSHWEFQKMVADIQNNPAFKGKMVLISWEHHLIPEIAYAFGVNPKPPKWPGDVFDRILKLTFEDEGRVTLKNLPQRLLFGDSEI